jgi:prepilin-type processing-associated H-X9-DG protein
MLLPALNNAREKSRASNCLSNMKQIMMSYSLYGQDNDGYLPNAQRNSDWKTWIHLLEDGNYQRGEASFTCPSRKASPELTWYKTTGVGLQWTFNPGAQYDSNWSSIYVRESQITAFNNNSNLVVFADIPTEKNSGFYWFNPSNGIFDYSPDVYYGIQLRHNKKMNVAFFDGHAGALGEAEARQWKHYSPRLNVSDGAAVFTQKTGNW